MAKYNIADSEVLTRVRQYALYRGGKLLFFIDVHEIIEGKGWEKGRFTAIPSLLVKEAKAAYRGFGDSESAALEDCLNKIKDVSRDIVIV